MRLRSLAVALALSLPVVAQAAPASFSSCVGTGYDLTQAVTNTYDCTISDDFDQDFLNTNPLTVNEPDGFFDITTWEYLSRVNLADGAGGAGVYDFSAALNALALPTGEVLDKVMLIFKSGSEQSGVSLVGYLAEIFVVSGDYVVAGDWDSPFTDPPFDFTGNSTLKNVSHISAYYTTRTAAIPLPAAGWALLMALGGLGLAARRRRAA